MSRRESRDVRGLSSGSPWKFLPWSNFRHSWRAFLLARQWPRYFWRYFEGPCSLCNRKSYNWAENIARIKPTFNESEFSVWAFKPKDRIDELNFKTFRGLFNFLLLPQSCFYSLYKQLIYTGRFKIKIWISKNYI